MPRLVDVEVEEVSLVDRPANGRRFRLFKRQARRWWDTLREVPVETENVSETLGERIEKRLETALQAISEEMETLAKDAQESHERCERLEAQMAALAGERREELNKERQSLDPAGAGPRSLWRGVL